MKIHSIKQQLVEKRIIIETTHLGIEYNFTVKVIDGKMQGDYRHAFACSTLSYFKYHDEERIEHWQLIKKEVESLFKDDFDISINDKNDWINVKHDLPTTKGFGYNFESKSVLVVGFIGKERIVTEAFYSSALRKWRWYDDMYLDKVTHWMPLPEPPKE